MMTRHRDKDIIASLVKHKGIISRVAADLGYSRQNIYLRLKANPALQEVYDAIKEQLAEEIENCIVSVALDISHPSWFRAARYYSRVKMGWYESDRPSTSSLSQPVIVNLIPVSRDDGDLDESS